MWSKLRVIASVVAALALGGQGLASVPQFCADVQIRALAKTKSGRYEFEILAVRPPVAGAKTCALIADIAAKKNGARLEAETDPTLVVRVGEPFWASVSWLETLGDKGAVSTTWIVAKPRRPQPEKK